MRPRWRDYRFAVVVTLGWMAFTFAFNAVAGTNYGYLNGKPPTASLLDVLGPWPVYLFVEIAVVMAVWALMTWPWERMRHPRTTGRSRPLSSERAGDRFRRWRGGTRPMLMAGRFAGTLLMTNGTPVVRTAIVRAAVALALVAASSCGYASSSAVNEGTQTAATTKVPAPPRGRRRRGPHRPTARGALGSRLRDRRQARERRDRGTPAPRRRGVDRARRPSRLPTGLRFTQGGGRTRARRTARPAEPMTEDTIFDLASLTKCLATATAVMQLYEQGKVQFDDPVQKYLPEFNRADDPQRARVTVRMLLTHTSGEEPDVNLDDPWGLRRAEKGEGLHRALTSPLHSEPGAVYRYSDINYILLGALIEKVTGEAEDTYVERSIFSPLGMGDTGTSRPPRRAGRAGCEEPPSGGRRAAIRRPGRLPGGDVEHQPLQPYRAHRA